MDLRSSLRSSLRAVPAAVLLLALQAGPASAHARYESSDPADKSTVSLPPSGVTADFSEPVTSDSYLRVTDPCGEVVSGASSPSADKVSVSMSGEAAGTYSVYFRVQSSIDSHVTDGTFTFSSSGGSPCPGEGPPGGGGGGGGDEEPGDDGGGGGSQSNDGGDAPTTGDDGVDEPTGGDAPVSSSAEDPSAGKDSAGGGGGRDQSKHEREGRRRGTGQREVELSLQNTREREAPPPWEGLPADGVIWALAIAALIGAAGGRIYASIMGPRA